MKIRFKKGEEKIKEVDFEVSKVRYFRDEDGDPAAEAEVVIDGEKMSLEFYFDRMGSVEVKGEMAGIVKMSPPYEKLEDIELIQLW